MSVAVRGCAVVSSLALLAACAVKCGNESAAAGAAAVPPSPTIVLAPSPGSSPDPLLEWRVDGDVQVAGPSIIDPSDSANFCRLRDDFLGSAVDTFRVEFLDGGQRNPAGTVELTGSSYRLVIRRTAANRLLWSIITLDGTVVCDDLLPSGSIDSGTVPAEFVDFPRSGFRESTDSRPGRELVIGVRP